MDNSFFTMTIRQDNSLAQRYNVDGLPLFLSRENIDSLQQRKTLPHWNNDLEIVYILSGSMMIIANGDAVLMKKGDIGFITPGSLHYFEGCEGTDCCHWIGILNEELFTSTEFITRKYVSPLFHSYRPGFAYVPPGTEHYDPLVRTFAKMYQSILQKEFGYELLVSACCFECLAHLAEIQNSLFSISKMPDTRHGIALQKMLGYIARNYSRRITPEELCEDAGISRNMCFRLFKEFTGETLNNYILKYRISAASSLLADMSLPISEIAIRCGFSQQSHFSRHFTNEMGMTPLQYRKKQYIKNKRESR